MVGPRHDSEAFSRHVAGTLVMAMALAAAGCAIEGTPGDLRRPTDASATDTSADYDADHVEAGAIDGPTESDAAGAVEASSTDAPDARMIGPCEGALALDLPGVGETQTIVLDVLDAPAELRGTCGGLLGERVVLVQPAADATILVTAGGPNSFSPVLYALADACISAPNAEQLGCQTGPPGTELMLQLQQARDYFIVVDTDAASAYTSTVLTIVRLI